ncbi:MAG: hypothetical protein KKH72_05210 [Alphaproteobacteria bacterium]|nr:hypothetical protein [Alphaproteobacteria bacterium]
MEKTVTILGINGRIGHQAARAFLAAGWQVTGLGRADRTGLAGITFIAGDADSSADVARAAAPSEVVLDAVNLPYDKWDRGRFEMSLSARLAGLEGSGKTLLYPGNIYNYAAQTHVLTPGTAQHPARDKGEIRVRLEGMMQKASHHGLKVVILRAPDFFGPGAKGTMFDLVMLKNIEKGVLAYPGDPGIGHSWAYLPDLARAFVRLAEERQGLESFERFHFAGHFKTGHELRASAERGLGRKLELRQENWLVYRLIGLFVPIVREIVKMSYLWQNPHRLEDPRLDALLGPDFLTPFDEALAKTLKSYLPDQAVARQLVGKAA